MSFWRATYLFLTFLVAAIFTAVVRDVFGDEPVRRILPLIVITALGNFTWFMARPDDFRPFILYEASAMLLSLAGYTWLGWKGSLAGSRWIAASIAVNIAAAAIQADGSARLTLIWPFDLNGIFHLIQVLGIALLIRGLGSGPMSLEKWCPPGNRTPSLWIKSDRRRQGLRRPCYVAADPVSSAHGGENSINSR